MLIQGMDRGKLKETIVLYKMLNAAGGRFQTEKKQESTAMLLALCGCIRYSGALS